MGRIDYINEYEYDLFIRPDTCSPRFRCWFLFTVENVKADQVSIDKYQLDFSFSSNIQINSYLIEKEVLISSRTFTNLRQQFQVISY